MKFLISFLLLLAVPAAKAVNMASSSYTTRTITVSGSAYDLSFGIQWTCDDFPQTGAPGKVELLDAGGNVLAEVVASLYMNGPQYDTTGGQNSVSDISTWGAVFTPGGQVADGGLSATWHLTGLSPGTYTLRLWRFTTWDGPLLHATTIWTNTYFVSGSDANPPPPPPPANSAPNVTLDSPGAQTVNVGTTLTISSHATDADGNLTGHNLDIQRPAGDWNYQGGFATGEPFQGGPVGDGSGSTRTANFTFTDVGTYYIRAAADDGSGWVHSSTVAITVVAPAPTQYSLSTGADTGGSVSPGGSFTAGTVANVYATPDAYHDFAGWTGDAGGAANPLGLTMDRDKAVQAVFSLKQFALTTSATSGGSVTPGGSYPYGSIVTLDAVADSASRFIGWSGGASGTATSTAVTITGPLTVQAVFVPKNGQTLSFSNPGNRPSGSPPFALDGTASSGLPVVFSVLSGPATFSNGQLQITGAGPVTVQANQPGDAYYLPATPVTQTFNVVAPVVLKYRLGARTVLQARAPDAPANLVLENP